MRVYSWYTRRPTHLRRHFASIFIINYAGEEASHIYVPLAEPDLSCASRPKEMANSYQKFIITIFAYSSVNTIIDNNNKV